MKGLYFDQHGGVDQLQYGDLPDPRPAAGEVLVRLEAVALNHMDLLVLEGWRGLELEMPHIPGADGAGRVAELGEGVDQFAVGDRVVIYPNLSCGHCEYCVAGDDNLCREWRLLGEHTRGTFRQLMALPANSLLKMPEDFDPALAAAAPTVYLTAWHSLITRGKLRPGELVLVVGASGGVNSASIQIARLAGARVAVVGSTAEKLELAEQLGAELTIDRTLDENWSKTAYLYDGRHGVDVVVDNVGAPTMASSLRAVRKGGRILTVGNTAGPKYEIDHRYLFAKHISIIGSTMGSRSEFAQVMQLVYRDQLQPALDVQYPLQQAAAAYQRMQAGEQLGKITLAVDAETA